MLDTMSNSRPPTTDTNGATSANIDSSFKSSCRRAACPSTHGAKSAVVQDLAPAWRRTCTQPDRQRRMVFHIARTARPDLLLTVFLIGDARAEHPAVLAASDLHRLA